MCVSFVQYQYYFMYNAVKGGGGEKGRDRDFKEWEQEYLSGYCLFSHALAAQRQSTAIGHPAGWRERPKHADGTTAIAQKSGCEWSGDKGVV